MGRGHTVGEFGARLCMIVAGFLVSLQLIRCAYETLRAMKNDDIAEFDLSFGGAIATIHGSAMIGNNISNLTNNSSSARDSNVEGLLIVNTATTRAPMHASSHLSRLSNSSLQVEMTHGVLARAFERWPQNRSLPCYDPDPEMKKLLGLRSPANRGFFFMKLMKTGGSTAAGIHARMSKNEAMRLSTSEYSICNSRFDHAIAFNLMRDIRRNESIIWTVVREPTQRAISQYFHFEVSRENASIADDDFIRYLHREAYFRNYYLRTLNLVQQPVTNETAPHRINKILSDYDFIGVTERMDETAVAFMMLFRLPMSDILYLDAKGSGGFDDGAHHYKCFFIQPSVVSPGMKVYFEDKYWQTVVHWDTLLYKAANRSLDLTIDRLGRQEFEKNLDKFRRVRQVAQERCIPRNVFPCSPDGRKNRKSDCIWSDSGCGWECLNEVAAEWELE